MLPRDFVFGASTAAYQIEGAVTEDGRGPSIWDTFTEEAGRVVDGSTGAVACDHYHRYREDVGLMRGLGLDGYRFSLAWPRIQPTGAGPANPAGLDFYDRLVDDLVAAGVTPMATLYHWDLPQSLQDEGGWLSRDTALRFADYAAIVAERIGDRVGWWVPVNEPNVVTLLGHGIGTHAPGLALSYEALPVAHHLLLAHGLAADAIRNGPGTGSVGTAANHCPVWPVSDDDADTAAADLFDILWNRLYSDPVLLGRYPEGIGELLPVHDGDLATISTPLDFYGVNYYNPMQVGAPAKAADGTDPDIPFDLVPIEGYPTTDFDWPVIPDGLRDLLVSLKERYPDLPPVYITENGCAYDDATTGENRFEDQSRIDYLEGHLGALDAAIEAGVDVRGYFTWSLLDNFEWAEGYTKRFGLVHVDYETQVRTPRASYTWYRDRIAAHRA